MRMGGLRGRASVPIFRTPKHKGKISRDRLGRQDLRLVLEPGPWHNRGSYRGHRYDPLS